MTDPIREFLEMMQMKAAATDITKIVALEIDHREIKGRANMSFVTSMVFCRIIAACEIDSSDEETKKFLEGLWPKLQAHIFREIERMREIPEIKAAWLQAEELRRAKQNV